MGATISRNETADHDLTDPVLDDLGIHTRVVAALSLRGDHVWQHLSSLVMGELADYVQPPTFGVLRLVLPGGQFTEGAYCNAHGDEVYFGDESHRCLAVYRDNALNRIGEGQLDRATGSAVVGDTVFVADQLAHCISVYPRAGGARLRHFGSCGSRMGEVYYPEGLAAFGGRVYVAEGYRVSVFAEHGEFDAHLSDTDDHFAPYGVAVDAHGIYVAGDGGCVRVFRADNLSVERRIGGGILQHAWGVWVSGGLLFVSDSRARRVVAFDVATGDSVASLMGFDEQPFGVVVGADGTLFVATGDDIGEGRLYEGVV